jgi:hypothetical protein
MATATMKRGYFSLLRWRSDVLRDEAKNVAVLLVGPEGEFGGFRAASLSHISSRLQEQGILDNIIESLNLRFSEDEKPDLKFLNELHKDHERSIVITEPKPIVVTDVDATLKTLYKAYVAPGSFPSTGVSRGEIINRVLKKYRAAGYKIRTGDYIGSFIFDLIVEDHGIHKPKVGEVISFASDRKDWIPIEHDAGYFIYATGKVERDGFAIVQPPTNRATELAIKSHNRVTKWFSSESIKIFDPAQIIRDDVFAE